MAATRIIVKNNGSIRVEGDFEIVDETGKSFDLAGREALVSTLGELCSNPDAPATVLVTHHVEEIPVGVTHGLLLKQGRVFAAGPIHEVLTDQLLSETFDIPLEVSFVNGRWSARGKA